MLRRIEIRNIALIEELTVCFGAGFSALTGETGAGKSILVDAMNFALGERADRELVRTGADRARVEAEFDAAGDEGVLEELRSMEIPCDDKGKVLVVRELSSAGRGSVKINGVAQPLSALKKLTARMVDLHGQHEHQSLLDEARHLGLLDAFAAAEIAQCKRDVAALHARYAAARRELKALSGDTRDRALRVDMLSFQINEIESARLKENEEEKLRAESDRMRNMERIVSAVLSARTHLSGGERSRGAVSALQSAAAQMRSIETYDEAYGRLADSIEESAYAMQDVAMEISSLADGDEIDPRRIDFVEQRLDDIRALKRKYGDGIAEILEFAENARRELERLNNSEELAKELEQTIAGIRAELLAACARLSDARADAAHRFSQSVLEELSGLGMAGARFSIEVSSPEEGFEDDAVTAQGYDTVRFLFSANAGEPARPLARIASGGEMSRVMLALKSVSAGEIGCLIFDEIDTGVSGRMAQTVGEKIARIARERQVVCVTHLPQIACMADAQYVVYKAERDGRAGTYVDRLDDKGRIDEIARLVGGADGEAAAKEHAAGMLAAADERKREI